MVKLLKNTHWSKLKTVILQNYFPPDSHFLQCLTVDGSEEATEKCSAKYLLWKSWQNVFAKKLFLK